MKLFNFLTVAVLFTAVLSAQEPATEPLPPEIVKVKPKYLTIELSQPDAVLLGRDTYEQYTLLTMRANIELEPDESAVYFWFVSPRASTREYFSGKELVITGAPGSYEARCDCVVARIVEGRIVQTKKSEYTSFFIRGPPKPQPPVDPIDPTDPTDPTDPPPTEPTGVKKAVVVHESSRNPISPHAVAARDAIEEEEIEYYITDKDVVTGSGNVPEYLKSALDAAKGKTLPVLVTLDGEDEAIDTVPLPDTTQGIVDAVVGA